MIGLNPYRVVTSRYVVLKKQTARVAPVYRISGGIRIPVPTCRRLGASVGLVRVSRIEPPVGTGVEALVGIIQPRIESTVQRDCLPTQSYSN
jgi:hypothetical protein